MVVGKINLTQVKEVVCGDFESGVKVLAALCLPEEPRGSGADSTCRRQNLLNYTDDYGLPIKGCDRADAFLCFGLIRSWLLWFVEVLECFNKVSRGRIHMHIAQKSHRNLYITSEIDPSWNSGRKPRDPVAED